LGFSLFSGGPKNKNVLYLFRLFGREAAIYLRSGSFFKRSVPFSTFRPRSGHLFAKRQLFWASINKERTIANNGREAAPVPFSAFRLFGHEAQFIWGNGTWKWVTITIKPNSRRRSLIDASCPIQEGAWQQLGTTTTGAKRPPFFLKAK
jgi:hypothetical protein